METNKIYPGDCLELFKQVPDDFAQITFADPPFNLDKKYKSYKDNLAHAEYLNWCDKWLGEMVRVTKPGGSIFVHNIPYWLSYYCCYLNEIVNFKHWIAWEAPSAPMGKSLQPAHYGILYYFKGDKPKFYEVSGLNKRCRQCRYLLKDYGGKKDTIPGFGPLCSDCITDIEPISANLTPAEYGSALSDYWTDIHRIKHNKYRDEHPCQLPIHLLERIILMSTDEGDIVLDPFVGTGTTAIAAKRLGRQYIGFELSPGYVKAAELKLEKETELSKLGPSWVSSFDGQRGKCKVVTIRTTDWPLIKGFFDVPGNIKELNSTEISLKKENNNGKK